MRYTALAVILAVLLSAGVASGQLYEPYHRPGEQPLGFRPSDVKISDAVVEYDYTLYLFGERDPALVNGLVKMQVLRQAQNAYVLGVALQMTDAKGFSQETSQRLVGVSIRFVALIDAATHEVKAVLPDDVWEPELLFTAGFGDYLGIRQFLSEIGWIEPGMKLALRNKQQLSFGEVRNSETGSRFIRMWVEKQNTASFAPTKLPVIEVTLVPHWPVIRTLWVVWDKPVNLPAPLGKRLPALLLKLR